VDVVAAEPEALFVACCGYDEERALADLAELAAGVGEEWGAPPAVRARRVHVADGTRFFSRPGPGLVDSLELLAHALDPDAHAPPTRARPARHVGMPDLRRTLAAAAHQ
jgi:iron complex transport system substrate-binding protein